MTAYGGCGTRAQAEKRPAASHSRAKTATGSAFQNGWLRRRWSGSLIFVLWNPG